MNNCKVVHETIIKDIVDVLMDIKDTDEIQYALGKSKSFKSISSASANLICVFPVLVDRSIGIERAQMIAKAYERKAVAMLQMLFSAFSISDAENAQEYIRQFHTNLKVDDKITIDRFVDAVDQWASKLDESSGIDTSRDIINAVKEDLKNLNYYLQSYDSMNDTPISAYKVVPEASYGRYGTSRVICEAPGDNNRNRNNGGRGGNNERTTNINRNENITRNINTTNTTTNINRSIPDVTTMKKNSAEYYSKQILDTDIKKSNELMPTLMAISFLKQTEDGSDLCKVSEAVIGVKAKMYPVNPDDIIDRLSSMNKDKNGLNNFIRASTREISFWKDFIFAIDRAKLDAIAGSNRGSSSKIWKLLQRRALKSRIRRNFRMENDATAITSLALSQETAEALMIQSNMNIENDGMAHRMMEAWNLMSICIVDEALEIAKFIYDTGDDMYESLSFNALERDSSDATYKRVVNLITKMR